MKRRALIIIIILFIIFLGFFLLYNKYLPQEKTESEKKTIIKKEIYGNKIINEEGIFLKDNEIMEIIDTNYILHGDITLNGNSKLIIKDSNFEQKGEASQAFSLKAFNYSEVLIENSVLRTSNWVDWSFFDDSKLQINNVDTLLGMPWYSFLDSTQANIYHSIFGGTIFHESKLNIQNSQSVFVELYAPKDGVLNESNLLSDYFVDNFEFPNENDFGIDYSVIIKNSSVKYWGVGVSPKGKLILENSRQINICMPIHWPYVDEEFYFNDLRRDKVYEKRSIEYGENLIFLKNSSAKAWCLNAHEKNIVHVLNSDIDDINHNGGNGILYYDNITSSVAIASDNNYIEISNSKIKGDVVAKDNSKIVLINTEVEGEIYEVDNGKVIIND